MDRLFGVVPILSASGHSLLARIRFAVDIVALTSLLAACDQPCDAGYDEGERIRVTVLSLELNGPDEVAPGTCYFAEGDTFVLVAGPWHGAPECRGDALGGAPLSTVEFSVCTPWENLGMQCWTSSEPDASPPGCGESELAFFLSTKIERDDVVREDAKIRFSWLRADCLGCSGFLNVRIEMLDRQ